MKRRTPKEIIADFKRQKEAEKAKKKETEARLRKEREIAWQEAYRRKQRMLKQAEIEVVKRDKVKVLPINDYHKKVDGEIFLNLTKLPYGHKGYELFLDCYQTEEEIRQAENSPLESGKINWEIFHKLIQDFRKENGIDI